MRNNKVYESVVNIMSSSRDYNKGAAERVATIIENSDNLVESAKNDIILAEKYLKSAAQKLSKSEYMVSSDPMVRSMGLISSLKSNRNSINCMFLSSKVRKLFDIHEKFRHSLRSALNLVLVDQHVKKEDWLSF